MTLFPLPEAKAAVQAVMDTCQFLPSRYELRQACEAQALPRQRAAERARSEAAQLAEREVIEREKDAPRQTVEEVEDEMAVRGVHLPGWISRQARKQVRTYREIQDDLNMARNRPEKATGAIPDPPPPHHPGTILTNYAQAVAVYGRPVGVFEPGRQRPYGQTVPRRDL